MNYIDLGKMEVETLRELYWRFQEAQQDLNKALNDISLAHNCDIANEKWDVTPDFKRLKSERKCPS